MIEVLAEGAPTLPVSVTLKVLRRIFVDPASIRGKSARGTARSRQARQQPFLKESDDRGLEGSGGLDNVLFGMSAR